MNRGNRLRLMGRYLLWYAYHRPLGHRVQADLPNGMRTWVHADSDSGVSHLFTRNVDTLEWEWIRKHLIQGDFIIDAGCNVGNRSLALADRIGGALMLDANPECLERVKSNFELNQVSLEQFILVAKAVGAGEGEVRFTDRGGSDCQNRVFTDAGTADDVSRTVPLTSLDAEMAQWGWPPAVFCKLDLEGHDLEALKGARRTLLLPSMKLVLFERWPSLPLEEFFAFFNELKWQVYALDALGTPTQDPRQVARARNLFAARSLAPAP